MKTKIKLKKIIGNIFYIFLQIVSAVFAILIVTLPLRKEKLAEASLVFFENSAPLMNSYILSFLYSIPASLISATAFILTLFYRFKMLKKERRVTFDLLFFLFVSIHFLSVIYFTYKPALSSPVL